MGGVIRADVKGGCPCGGNFKSQKDSEYSHPVPRCISCNKPPKALKIRVSLPVVGKKDIRYNREGSRFTTLALADAFLVELHKKISKGTFEAERYLTSGPNDKFLVKTYLKEYLEIRERSRGKAKGCAPGYLDDCWKLYKNHLLPFFGNLDLRELNYQHFQKFLTPQGKGDRQRVKAMGLLKLMYKELVLSYPSITVPNMPSLTPSKRKNEHIKRGDQYKVLKCLAAHVEALTLAVIYPIRPCEIRALQWRDFDFQSKTMTIRRHFSGTEKEPLPGRKSQSNPNDPYSQLELEIFPEVERMLKAMPVVGMGSEYVFKTNRGKPLYETALRKSWNLACEKAGVPHIAMYNGTKHSTMSHYVNVEGVPIQDMRAIAGHTNSKTTERYVTRDSRGASSHLRGRHWGAHE